MPQTLQVNPYLIPGQDFEGGHHLVGSVRVRRLAGHEVDEGLEGDEAHPVGVHYAHDARELVFTLEATERNCEAEVAVEKQSLWPCTYTTRQMTDILHMVV